MAVYSVTQGVQLTFFWVQPKTIVGNNMILIVPLLAVLRYLGEQLNIIS